MLYSQSRCLAARTFLRSYFRNYGPHPLFPSMSFRSDCEQPPKATTLLLVRDFSGNQINFVVERDGAIVGISYYCSVVFSSCRFSRSPTPILRLALVRT
jgi:hypothetical protein